MPRMSQMPSLGPYILFLCGAQGFIFVCHGHMRHCESAVDLECDCSRQAGIIF